MRRTRPAAGAGGRVIRAARALGILAAAAAAALASAASAGASATGALTAGAPAATASATADPPAGVAATFASPYGAPVSGPSGWTCTYTNPEYMIHGGGATLSVQPGKARFTVTSAPRGRWSDPYITAGYNASLNSQLCNSRVLPASGGKHGKSYALPVRLGRTGRITSSVHDVTSANFRGDTGFDIWFEPDPAINRYSLMANQGAAATEIMIWLSHPGLPPRSTAYKYYPVIIDGRHWTVAVALASRGHGKSAAHPNGWNLVEFIAPRVSEGDVHVSKLFLNPFFSYEINHHWLPAHDYLMAIDQGAEFTQGTMRVADYGITGLR
jgi:hypothetical protein